jgi:hypothetical protein
MPHSRVSDFALLDGHAEPLLWSSLRAGEHSAWHGHVSFAHWIVRAIAPKSFVELGSHAGVSFAAFCNGVARGGLPTRCFAVDTWRGDDHAGQYGDHIYQDVARFTRKHFSSFATLMRCCFDEAIPHFADGSIDLLHIDGLHTYDAVKADFEAWLPKLSDTAVVLFHDTVVHENGFGVWQLWEELSARYPSFNFEHAYGLGVLGVGVLCPGAVTRLCALRGPDIDQVRGLFQRASELAYLAGPLEHLPRRTELLQHLSFPGTNIALGRPASQSSSNAGEGMTPGNAVNGHRTGTYAFHTGPEPAPWWMVDLGPDSTFDAIVVFNRLDNDCDVRAQTLSVHLSHDSEAWCVLFRNDGRVFGGIDGRPLVINCPGTRARFVRLKLHGPQYLHLDQVEIYRHDLAPT